MPGRGRGAGWRRPPPASLRSSRPGWPGCVARSSRPSAGAPRTTGSRQTRSAAGSRETKVTRRLVGGYARARGLLSGARVQQTCGSMQRSSCMAARSYQALGWRWTLEIMQEYGPRRPMRGSASPACCGSCPPHASRCRTRRLLAGWPLRQARAVQGWCDLACSKRQTAQATLHAALPGAPRSSASQTLCPACTCTPTHPRTRRCRPASSTCATRRSLAQARC